MGVKGRCDVRVHFNGGWRRVRVLPLCCTDWPTVKVDRWNQLVRTPDHGWVAFHSDWRPTTISSNRREIDVHDCTFLILFVNGQPNHKRYNLAKPVGKSGEFFCDFQEFLPRLSLVYETDGRVRLSRIVRSLSRSTPSFAAKQHSPLATQASTYSEWYLIAFSSSSLHFASFAVRLSAGFQNTLI